MNKISECITVSVRIMVHAFWGLRNVEKKIQNMYVVCKDKSISTALLQ